MKISKQPRILIIGAGVIGSLYGYKFATAGYNITFLAKENRLKQLQLEGLNLYCTNTKKAEWLDKPNVIEQLDPNDIYDYVFITLRRDNLPSIYPTLAENHSHCFVFMANNPYGSKEYEKHLPLEKVIMAFPGAAGDIKDGTVHYTIVSSFMQPTTVGSTTHKQEEKLKAIVGMLKNARFPVSVCKHMDAWMLTHAAMICPLTNAIYFAQGSSVKAAKSKTTMRYTAQALKEAFYFLHKSKKHRIAPAKLKIFVYIPTSILRFILSIAYRTSQVKAMMPNHTSHSQVEMQLLSDEFATIAEKEGFGMAKYRLLSKGRLQEERFL